MAQQPDDPPRRPRNPIERFGESRARRASQGWGQAYQGAMEATVALAISVGIGMWIDSKLGSSPVGLLVGLAIGFGSFVLRLWRLMKEMAPGPPDGGPPGPGGPNGPTGAKSAKSAKSEGD